MEPLGPWTAPRSPILLIIQGFDVMRATRTVRMGGCGNAIVKSRKKQRYAKVPWPSKEERIESTFCRVLNFLGRENGRCEHTSRERYCSQLWSSID